MNNNKKHNRRKKSFVTTIITGTTMSLVISMLLIAVVSELAMGSILDIAQIAPAIYLIIFVSVLLGAFFSVRNTESHIATTVAAITGMYLFILITINIIFYEGIFDRLWISLTTAIAAAAISVLLSIYVRKGKRSRYIR